MGGVSIGGHPEYAVTHARLQDAAIAAAHEAGATIFRPAKVIGLKSGASPGPDLSIGEDVQSISARLIGGADGKNSSVRGWAGLGASFDSVRHRIGGVLFDGVTLQTEAAHESRFAGDRVFSVPLGRELIRSYIVTATDRHHQMQRDRSGRRGSSCSRRSIRRVHGARPRLPIRSRSSRTPISGQIASPQRASC